MVTAWYIYRSWLQHSGSASPRMAANATAEPVDKVALRCYEVATKVSKLASAKRQRKLTPSDIVIYIVPGRIQAKRRQILKNCAKSNNYQVKDVFSNEVTHILTDFDTQEQVFRAINESPESTRTSVEILSTKWLSDSVKQKEPITEHSQLSIYQIKGNLKLSKQVNAGDGTQNPQGFPAYACQRKALNNHKNTKLVYALEILVKHAQYRDDGQGRDSSRALAFSKAAAVLKSLPYELKNMEQVKTLNYIGSHCMQVIQDILRDGISAEVQETIDSEWFKTMEIFNGVYGIGPTYAKKLFEEGYRTIEDLNRASSTSTILKDKRIIHGLAFYEDLKCLTLSEAEQILFILKTEAEGLLTGIRVELTGGFRRGKCVGHDADFLFTHPQNGTEIGFLPQFYAILEEKGFILHGQVFNSDHLKKPGRQATMDSFEKCFLIFRCPLASICVEQQTASFAKTHKSGNFELLWNVSRKPRSWKAARIDLVVCPSSQHAYALVGWTGNKHFNRSLRTYANKELNMKLTSHGLWDMATNKSIPASSEKEVFTNLKLDYLEPWERNA